MTALRNIAVLGDAGDHVNNAARQLAQRALLESATAPVLLLPAGASA